MLIQLLGTLVRAPFDTDTSQGRQLLYQPSGAFLSVRIVSEQIFMKFDTENI
jgi:hypothetical protein